MGNRKRNCEGKLLGKEERTKIIKMNQEKIMK